jgi:hypothetical protein
VKKTVSFRGKEKFSFFRMLYKSKKECKHSKYYFEKRQNFDVRYNILAPTVSKKSLVLVAKQN